MKLHENRTEILWQLPTNPQYSEFLIEISSESFDIALGLLPVYTTLIQFSSN